MALKIVGVKRSAGEFENSETHKTVEYDNIKLFCVRPMSSPKYDNWSFGDEIVEIKFKNDIDVVVQLFGAKLSREDFSKLIGLDVNCFYDENKKPVMLMFPNVDIKQVLKPTAKA